MPNFTRSGDCLHCGDCCGGNNTPPTNTGWETIPGSLDDVSQSHNVWTLFGLAWNPVTEWVEPEATEGFHRVKGVQYHYTWRHEWKVNKGHIPCKDLSGDSSGSPFSWDCPFLMDDPGDGTRPCALVDSPDDGARKQMCRPEERAEPPLNYDIWTQSMVDDWNELHPKCTYTFTEIVL
jgi:hypothetical protein